jgi:hypothetical protein
MQVGRSQDLYVERKIFSALDNKIKRLKRKSDKIAL